MVENALDREAWLARRRAGIGSTDAAPILGKSKWKTALHVYLDKIGELRDEDSAPKKWGRKLEDVVAEAYHEQTGNPVYPPKHKVAVHPQHSILIASCDRETQIEGGEPANLEIKTSESGEGWGQPGTDDVPDYYLIQAQHQMMVTGLARTEMAVLIGGNRFQCYTIFRNEKFITTWEKVALDFWRKVENRTPPPIDWEHPATAELVKNLFGVTDAKEAILDDEAVLMAREYLLCKNDIKKAEDKRERFKNELLVRIGDAAVAIMPDGSRIHRKLIQRGGFTVKPSSYTTFNLKPSEEMKGYVKEF